jgi:hypothetical protein
MATDEIQMWEEICVVKVGSQRVKKDCEKSCDVSRFGPYVPLVSKVVVYIGGKLCDILCARQSRSRSQKWRIGSFGLWQICK